MKTIYASEFGILPGEEITENLTRLLKSISGNNDEKTVVFDRGTYYVDADKCEKRMLYITNTVGDNEFTSDETPHLSVTPFYFNNVSNLTFDGADSIFIIDGKATNMAVENCHNITFKNLEFRHAHPDMHLLTVIKKTFFTVDFQIDRDTFYEVNEGKLYFYGNGYRVCPMYRPGAPYWSSLIRENTPNRIVRIRHPFLTATKFIDLGNHKIRVHFSNTLRFKNGDCYHIFDGRRQYVGIFVNKSENINFKDVRQRFNYSLALVAQDSENISADSVEFAPEKESERKMASVADFFQFCMCRGKMTVKNSRFDGAGDDLLNIHGIHFKITNINKNEIVVRFMHSQTHGFNPLRIGDKIAYINSDTLLEEGIAVIEKSEMPDEYEIKLTVSDTNGAKIGGVIEDVSACSQLEFVGNTSTRIITRGLLVTTREKVNVENNHFASTTMSGVLLSDDAKNWYESGMCRDVTIKNNVFDFCGGTPILIKPENVEYNGAVHKNINIIGNTFKKYKGACISAKATDNIAIKDNTFANRKRNIFRNCKSVKEQNI